MSERRRALISVSDKRDIEALGAGLAALGWELLSTGGTAKALRAAGLSVTEVADFTGAPEILDGRVKTLHPKVHAGILARRDHAGDMATLASLGHPPIDLVCVNLYPFEGRPSLEEIDIGGPTLVRAAAKNHEGVVVLVRPEDYEPVLAEMRAGDGAVLPETRRRLAATAFARIAEYDIAIAAWLGRSLRYGENPHQMGALVGDGPGRVLGGKELSYNNLLDIDAAVGLVRDLPTPGAAIVKHATPCGAAIAADAAAAFLLAYGCDPLSAYGGIVALNVPCTQAAALAMTESDRFLECVAAPSFEPEALKTLTTRPRWGKNVRLVETTAAAPARLARTIAGGLLVQGPDSNPIAEERLEFVSSRAPTPALEADLRIAITVAKHARSNAIAVVRDGALVGCGAGQTSRVEATEIALRKAGERARGAVLASDAFFPFSDSLERAGAAGVTAVVAPRGSRRDAEVKAKADELGMAFAFTDLRHFRH